MSSGKKVALAVLCLVMWLLCLPQGLRTTLQFNDSKHVWTTKLDDFLQANVWPSEVANSGTTVQASAWRNPVTEH